MKNAFTLVETLVVVVIVSLLSALAIPTISNVLDKTKSTETVARLRQLQLANQHYAADHDGRYLPLYTGTGFLSDGWKWNPDFLAYLNMEADAIGTPAWEKAMNSAYWNSSRQPHAQIAYYASIPWSDTAATGIRSSMIVNPTQLIAFIDANDWWVNPYSHADWVDRSSEQQSAPRPAYRNSGGRAAAVTYGGNILLLSKAELDPFSDQGKRHWFVNGESE